MSRKTKIVFYFLIVLVILGTIFDIYSLRIGSIYMPFLGSTINIPLLFIFIIIFSSIIGGLFVLSYFQGTSLKLILLGEMFSLVIIILHMIFLFIRALSVGGDAYFSLFAIPMFLFIALIVSLIINLIILKILDKSPHQESIEQKQQVKKISDKAKRCLVGGLIGFVFGIIFCWQSLLSINPIIPRFLLVVFGFPFIIIGSVVPSIFITALLGIIIYSAIGSLISISMGKIKSRK
jgi:hypothetical protein